MRYMLESAGAALIAVAATNKPHLPQRGGEITVIERDGEPPKVRIPIARRGVYRHPRGKIKFTQQIFDQMIENHLRKVTDNPVHLDLRHKDTEGALAWLDPDDGGYLTMEGDWLVGYGPATDERAVDLIKSKRYRFSSAEFTPDYRSNLVERLSADDMTYLGETEVTLMKFTVAGIEFEVQEADGGLTLTKEQLDKINSAVKSKADAEAAALAKVEALEQAKADAEKKLLEYQKEDEPAIPEAFKLRLEALEAERDALEAERETERVAFTLEQAKQRRVDGRGIDEGTLTFFKKVMLLEGDETVKLEDASNPRDMVRYMRGMLKKYLLEVHQPVVPMETKTNGDEDVTKLESTTDITEEMLQEKIKSFWNGIV